MAADCSGFPHEHPETTLPTPQARPPLLDFHELQRVQTFCFVRLARFLKGLAEREGLCANYFPYPNLQALSRSCDAAGTNAGTMGGTFAKRKPPPRSASPILLYPVATPPAIGAHTPVPAPVGGPADGLGEALALAGHRRREAGEGTVIASLIARSLLTLMCMLTSYLAD